MVKIFAADVSRLSVEQEARLYASLPSWRRELLDRFQNHEQKILSAGAGYLLAPALAEFGIDAMSARIAFGEYGKPYLADYPQIRFSLSHSGSMVMCGVANSPIGCDIQCLPSHPEHNDSVAKRFFTPNEQRRIASSITPEREFVRLWTLKESYVKYLGTGISGCPFDSFEVLGSPPRLRRDGVERSLPRFFEYIFENSQDDGGSTHFAAVCCDESAEDAMLLQLAPCSDRS